MLSGNFFFVFHDAGWPAPGPHHAHAMTAASVNFQLFWQALSAKSCKITPPSTAHAIARQASARLLCPWDKNSSNRHIYKSRLDKFTSAKRLCQIQSGKFPSLDNNKEKFVRTDPLYWLTLSSSELLVSQLELGNREQRWESSEQKKKSNW